MSAGREEIEQLLVQLPHQESIRPEDDGKTIETLRAELAGTIGENIEIKRFARFEVGGE